MKKTNVEYVIKFKDDQGRNHRATINSLGCGLVDYSVDDFNVVFGIESENNNWHTDIFSGIAVFPWPNRLEDGKYEFNGVEHIVAINELDKMTQLHSFSQFYDFDLVLQEEDSVTLELNLPKTLYYPFEISCRVTYKFAKVKDNVRLITKVEAKNNSNGTNASPAPWGFCLHPWFNIRGDYQNATLQVDALKYVEVNERALPIGPKDVCEVPVNGKFDLQTPKHLKTSQDFDHAFVDLKRNDEGYAFCVLTSEDGHITKVGANEAYNSFQICTLAAKNRSGMQNTVALEPSTCYANAFRTGDNLVIIEPGELWSADSFIEFI